MSDDQTSQLRDENEHLKHQVDTLKQELQVVKVNLAVRGQLMIDHDELQELRRKNETQALQLLKSKVQILEAKKATVAAEAALQLLQLKHRYESAAAAASHQSNFRSKFSF